LTWRPAILAGLKLRGGRDIALIIRQDALVVHMPLITREVPIDIPLRAGSKPSLTRRNRRTNGGSRGGVT
jgi:hypothetical protein